VSQPGGEPPKKQPGGKPYRVGVGMVLFNRDGLVFVGLRVDQTQEAWQLPQGGLDPGEEPLAAAYRELAEEIGTDKVELMAEIADWLTYDLPPALAAHVWGGRFRGQRQKWFAFRFHGRDSDIDLDANPGTHTREFSTWKWAPIDQLPQTIVDFKRPIYERLVAEFRHLATTPYR
jgi:putative (di)nucleoside polyphosphate hydrolase